MKRLTSTEIRQKFLDFFARSGHEIVPSSPLVARMDPTLLFINAGMNQFKAVFTGQEKRPYTRATSAQKCVRAGGKHNDLENVGRTGRHHTFFEMLGNFSFGDYFKEEAIQFAWNFVTKELALPVDRLYVSVYQEDNDAFTLWNKKIGLDPKRIFRFGEKDNFWSMGETGPCGPCSEIFFDQGPSVGCGRPECQVGCDCDRYIEFWNLVFMEFNQEADGSRKKLPKPSIDTGMGLERVTAIAQGVTSNYDTDLFVPILAEIGKKTGKPYASASEEFKISTRVVADHIRAMTFLISDGVTPSNEGRGYVLRRIMRRAMRHGRKLGIKNYFLHELSQTVIEKMGTHYGELKKNAQTISKTIRSEEERFAQTIDRGLTLLSEQIALLQEQKKTVLPGDTAFHLYDTYGFPVDLTADVLREYGLTYDQVGFEEAFAQHREKARGSWKGSTSSAVDQFVSQWVSKGIHTEFLGYTELTAEGSIQALVRSGASVKTAKFGDEVELVADRTPFYGESGGQVGDIGVISGKDFSLEVIDTQRPTPDIVLHKCKVTEGEVLVGASATFTVDAKARAATAKNHTATHLLHATLKEVLGSHVTQKGSLVSPERLRFDFTNPAPLSANEISTIEQKMNERIWLNSQVQKEVLPLDKALASGAVALFDEKYGTEVRVITVSDYSKELCGGTHLDRTGEIGLFKIVREGSVAAGVRRLEAFTGQRALRYVMDLDQRMRELSSLLGTTPEEVGDRVKSLIRQQKDLKKKGSVSSAAATGDAVVTEINGIRFSVMELGEANAKGLRDIADREMEKIQSGVVALGAMQEGKAFVVVKVSKDLSSRLNAGDLVQPAAKILGGSGGGRPEMAQAGGPNVDQLKAALKTVESALK